MNLTLLMRMKYQSVCDLCLLLFDFLDCDELDVVDEDEVSECL